MINNAKSAKSICIAIAGLFAVLASLSAIYGELSYTLNETDKFNDHRYRIINLEKIIYLDNKSKFTSGKLSEEDYSKLVISILDSKNEIQSEIRETTIFLESIIKCKESFFCKLANDSSEYDVYIYAFWYLVEPYILQIKHTQAGQFSSKIEPYARKIRNNSLNSA